MRPGAALLLGVLTCERLASRDEHLDIWTLL
jgi:hypothetical protein